MRYLCSRRCRVPLPGDRSPTDHANIGVVDTVERARGELTRQLLVEALFNECEADVHGVRWRRDTARRLRRAADEVARFTDGVYRSVDVDGIRYGWVRLTNADAESLCPPI